METVVDTPDRPKPFRHVLAAPWFYRLGFAAARAVPVPVLYGIADGLGVATYLTSGRLVAAVRANLTRAFPQASERERSRLTRRILRNYVRYLVDYGRFRWTRREGFEALIPALEGGDHLQASVCRRAGRDPGYGACGQLGIGGDVLRPIRRQDPCGHPAGRAPADRRHSGAISGAPRDQHDRPRRVAVCLVGDDGSAEAQRDGGHAGRPVGGGGRDRVALLGRDASPSPRPLSC